MGKTKKTLVTAADAVAFIVRKADDYANRFGFGVGGALSFDSQVKLDHYRHLLDLAKEIRALDGRASSEAQTDLNAALAMVKGDRDRLSLELEHTKADLAELEERFRRINTPEIDDFLTAVRNEMLHQRERWGAEGDAGKTDADWFWLLGFLSQKAMTPGNPKEKVLHHIITTAAACGNWHGARAGHYVDMRPGTAQGANHD